MSYPKLLTEEIEEGPHRFTATILRAENAAFVLFNEKNRLLMGTLAVAMPQFGGRGPCISSVLLGERNATITKILAERLAAFFNQMVLVSTHLKADVEREVVPILMRLLQKLIERIQT